MENKTIRLLLVEDDKVDQMAFARFVRSENLPYDYTCAGSVAEGKEILQSSGFDVIIADYMLGDGVSFELFELFKDAPVIVTTGTGNEEVAVEAMKLGACDYLIKDPDGYYLKTLPTTVELALKRKQNEKQLQYYHQHLESMVLERTAELQAEVVERKRVEEALRKSKEQWNRTFNSITDIITLQDPDLRIVKVNRATCTALDLSCDEIIGHHCYELIEESKNPCHDCPVLETRETLLPCNREIYYKIPGKNFLVSAAPVFDEQGELEYITHVAKDITELKKLEKELFQAQKMEAIGTLAGGIAHDFNNILSAIIGQSEIIKYEAPENSTVRRDIQEVIEAGNRAADLVKQILTFSRKAGSKKQPLRPHLIIEEALKMLRSTLPTTISIKQNIDPDCGAILADPINIHQIIFNLCTNALHAMADEKGTLTISLQRQDLNAEELNRENAAPGSFVVISVSDTGCGMDKTTLDRIFDPYFTTKEVGKGTGLGLAVIQGIVHDAHGFIKVTSTPGKGSSFAICFPALQDKTATEHESGRITTPPPKGTEHILVVDDEPFLVRTTQRQLENLGYRITGTSNSQDALDMIRKTPEEFDLLITDQTMPGLTGTELALAVMEIRSNLPVLLCTGHSQLVSEGTASEFGIKKYLAKPVVADELFREVRSVLDGK